MSRYEPEIGGNVSLFADVGSQTDVMEIGQVKRLGKRSLQLIQRLNKLVRQLGDLREQALRSFEDYTITRVADIYETYERRLAFAKDRHEKRTNALNDHFEVQLEDYLNRAGGDWVLQFMGDYEKDIADIKESFLPAIKRADDLVHKLQARADANEEVIRNLSTKALRLENDAHKKGYSMADIDMLDADGAGEDTEAASDRRKAVSEMLELANVAGAYTGRTVSENDVVTAGDGHRSSKLEMDAVMMNAALSQTQKDLLLTRNGASRFNAVRPPNINVRAELSRFLDYCRAKQELLIDNIKARNRDEMEQVAKQCYESMLEVEAQLRDHQKSLLDTIKRSEEEEEALVKNADKHRMLAEIKARRQRAALSRLAQEQGVLKQLVPRVKLTGPERSPNKQESEGEDSSDEPIAWGDGGLHRELSYAALGRRHGRTPSVSGQPASAAGNTGANQVSNVIRSLRRHLAVSRKGGSRAGSMMSRASSKYLDVAMLETLSTKQSPVQSPPASHANADNPWSKSRRLLPDINPDGSSSPSDTDEDGDGDDHEALHLDPSSAGVGQGGSQQLLHPQSSDVRGEGMSGRKSSGHLNLIQKLNSQVEIEGEDQERSIADAVDSSLHSSHGLGSARHVRSSILALVGIEDDSSSVSSVQDSSSHAPSRPSTELSEDALSRQIQAALEEGDGLTDGGSVFLDSEAGDAYHGEEGNT
eukprot:TRINITY_DN18770_c0_g1_i1.p1 TRINITY_DN18770_c0_g1~~TRINITY_DN18770_c0_g1_i1.p1  ORF type:complete len:704 (+),score=100.80 TRINITY_DN18770_c0_g1_i1:304-2415(+)